MLLMKNKIAILGNGISGTLAAKALKDSGNEEFDIISKDSNIPKVRGFFLLHDSCNFDGIEKVSFKVEQLGREEVYKKKLSYNGEVSSSWKNGLESYFMVGYNPYPSIVQEWHSNRHRIVEYELVPEDFDLLFYDYDWVISTIPPNNLFKSAELKYSKIWIKDKPADDNGYYAKYFGTDDTDKIRESQLWGRKSIEYSIEKEGSAICIKPIKAKNLPKDDRLTLAGRKGKWNKNILAHQVYYQVLDEINLRNLK